MNDFNMNANDHVLKAVAQSPAKIQQIPPATVGAVSEEVLVTNWSTEMMLEVTLNEPDDFLKIRETLSRIGVASKKEVNTLYQSCHILHKQGRYIIMHFKELFLLDGKSANFSVDDLGRRNTIAILLADWGLLSIVDISKSHPRSSLRQIKIISHSEKANWNLQVKYQIGKVKSNR